MHILLHCAHTYAWVTCSSTFSGQPLSSFCSCCCINYQHQEQLLKLWWFGVNVPSTKSKFQWIALQHKVRIVDGFDPQDQLDPARPTYQLEGQFGKKKPGVYWWMRTCVLSIDLNAKHQRKNPCPWLRKDFGCWWYSRTLRCWRGGQHLSASSAVVRPGQSQIPWCFIRPRATIEGSKNVQNCFIFFSLPSGFFRFCPKRLEISFQSSQPWLGHEVYVDEIASWFEGVGLGDAAKVQKKNVLS